MKITQKQLDKALELTLEHHDEDDISVPKDGYRRWGYNADVAVIGNKAALEEFELYLASTFVVKDIDEPVAAYNLINAVINVHELRHEDDYGRDDVVFYYPQFELDN